MEAPVTEAMHSILPYAAHPRALQWTTTEAHLGSLVPADLNALQLAPMRRVKLGLDIDSVCADFVGSVLDVWYQETGLIVDRMALDQWSIFDCGLLDRDIVSRRVEQPGFCAGLRVFDGVKEALDSLRWWADIYAVTSPWKGSKHWKAERTEWLIRHLDIDEDHQVHTSAKELVKVDVFLDDRPENVAKWVEAFPKGYALLWDTPHNRKEHAGRRVKSWNEVLFQVIACSGGNGSSTLH